MLDGYQLDELFCAATGSATVSANMQKITEFFNPKPPSQNRCFKYSGFRLLLKLVTDTGDADNDGFGAFLIDGDA